MRLVLSEDESSVLLQLDEIESDKIMGDKDCDRADVLREVYYIADEFFMEDDADLPIQLDIGVPYGVLYKQAVGRYDWRS